MKQADTVQVRAENVTTGEKRRNSTCLELSTAKQNHEQTHHKANNDWDVFQDPIHKSESAYAHTHKLNHLAGLDVPMYNADSTPENHHTGIHPSL